MRDLTPADVKPRQLAMYRYQPLDLDGSVGFSGYDQRPAAERNILRDGRGIWDNRMKVVMVQPDEEKRFAHLDQQLKHKREELARLEVEREDLLKAVLLLATK